MSRLVIISLLLLATACTQAQRMPAPSIHDPARSRWVDSVFNSLSGEEVIGQLFMVAAYSGGPLYNAPKIEELIRKHQVGGLIFMQGGPERQAALTNRYQAMAQVPLLIAMDAEWGLGMRLDSIINLPKQMTLGAANDTELAYAMGMAVAYQCRKLGVHVNFAPVVDVNNNPANPVINARSFGEDKYRVTRLAIAYMRGMQDYGVMACAKHFPGHGDVSVDSHKDLPVISKSRARLDTLELYPFREMIKAGVQSMMIAHLAVPALDSEPHVPTTLSKATVTGLLKQEMGFNGIVFTDALDMKGLTKYFDAGEADARAFIAGNDMLLFSQDVPVAIEKIRAAIKAGKVTEADLEARVKKILAAKYNARLYRLRGIYTANLTSDINLYTAALNARVAEAAITVVRDRKALLPTGAGDRVLCVCAGGDLPQSAKDILSATKGTYSFVQVPKGGSMAAVDEKVKSASYDKVIVVVQGLSFYPGINYGLDAGTLSLLGNWAGQSNVIVAMMGNAYALKYVCNAGTLICGYEDNEWTGTALAKILAGTIKAKGTLPVTPPCLK